MTETDEPREDWEGELGEEEFFQNNDGFPKVATHSGSCHLDEVVGVGTLVLALGINPEAVIRTRRSDALSKMDILVDVGSVYDPDSGRFDHHQWKSGTEGKIRQSGIPYASAGLVWDRYGKIAIARVLSQKIAVTHPEILAPKIIEEVAREFDRFFVAPVDAVDTNYKMTASKDEEGKMKWLKPGDPDGVDVTWGPTTSPTLNRIMARYSFSWLERGLSIRTIFVRSVYVVSEMMQREIIHLASEALASRVIADALEARDASMISSGIVLLPAFVPWQRAIIKKGGVRFVVFPSKGGHYWLVKSVPLSLGSWESNSPLPKEWGGLRGAKLDAATGSDVKNGAMFAREEGFIAGHRNMKGAISMAKEAAKRFQNAPFQKTDIEANV